ncbi:MAG: AbrB/MazE/SpoVT family DNA-binding domain-containing protein [Anaerolineaceae bacterium]|nr:AbrB/MazE/SpoVT family DNA-binding domain-containing protein [Anaerolineaceae bacterium]
MANPPEGKRFYGAITVSERGQVVIPVEARRDFNIEVGDKLLVMGDLEKGLWIVKASVLLEKAPDLFSLLEAESNYPKEKKK